MNGKFLDLEQAIELGEYKPEFLSQFSEFTKLPRHSQWQIIRKASKNREAQLQIHYAELNNQLDFHNKPDLKRGLKNIEEQLRQLSVDEEKLLVEYSV